MMRGLFFFLKEETSSFGVRLALMIRFPIKLHLSLETAGPVTGRATNCLCQDPSQMVVTLSWMLFHNTTSSKY